MKTFGQQVIECIEDESKRHFLRGIPVCIVASKDYLDITDPLYWALLIRENRN